MVGRRLEARVTFRAFIDRFKGLTRGRKTEIEINRTDRLLQMTQVLASKIGALNHHRLGTADERAFFVAALGQNIFEGIFTPGRFPPTSEINNKKNSIKLDWNMQIREEIMRKIKESHLSPLRKKVVSNSAHAIYLAVIDDLREKGFAMKFVDEYLRAINNGEINLSYSPDDSIFRVINHQFEIQEDDYARELKSPYWQE